MKIGILTLPLHTNYGGILQAYALQTVLERMGHEVVVFDTPKSKMLEGIVSLFYNVLNCNQIKCFVNKHGNLLNAVISRKITPFLSKINRKEICNFKSIRKTDYDAIVVGSDQIWRAVYFPRWMEQSLDNAYLSFSNGWNIKRISYAASFGTDEWEYTEEQTNNCRISLKNFNAVSVREKSGIDLCKKYFGINAQLVLDPTMLLDVDDYLLLLDKGKTKKSKGNLLCYVLDETEELIDFKKRLSMTMHLDPFDVNNPYENDSSKSLKVRTKSSVESWIRGFLDAEFVITDSFHACVFSIIFRKQFLVFGNSKRGMTRFMSLLNLFGLEDRLVNGNCDFSKLGSIDYDSVYLKYNVLKKQSMSFLENHLK